MRLPVTRRAVLGGGLSLGLGLPAAPVPAQGPAPLTRIAFGSCADQAEPQPIWDAVLAFRPELFLFTGDNVYGDVTGPELRELAAAYAAARGIPGYRRLRETVPVLATWDDHDYGVNDAGADFAAKRGAQKLFAEFWDLPADDPRRSRDGVYSAAVFGPPGRRVQVILLDTRFFRSEWTPTDQRGALGKQRYIPDPDPAKTMLGETQWRWLEKELRQPAELRLLVSSMQVLAEGHGWERWGNFPRERQRLFDLVGETGAGGLVILSGDRHIGALYEERRGTPYPLVEITSSGINKFFRGATDLPGNRVGELYDLPNFGTVTVDWSAGEARLAVVGVEGSEQRAATVPIGRPRR